MTESTIKVQMQGVDNASQTIKQVKSNLEGLGVAADANASKMQKSGDALKAAMSATNGSISGVIGGIKGVTSALQGMGASISTALPIATAIGVSLAAIADIYRTIKQAQQARLDAIKAENTALDEQVKLLKQAFDEDAKRVQHRNRMTKWQEVIDDASPIEKASNAWGDAKFQRDITGGQIRETEMAIAELRRKMADNEAKITATRAVSDRSLEGFHLEPLYSATDRKVFEEANVAHAKALADAEATLKELQRKYKEEGKELDALKAVHDRLVKAEEERIATEKAKAAEERAKAIQDATSRKEAVEERIASIQKSMELSSLREQAAQLQAQIAEGSRLSEQPQLASTFGAGTHATNLLLDRLNGGGKDSTSQQVSENVREAKKRLEDILKRIDALVSPDLKKELDDANAQRDRIIEELENLETI